MKGLILTYLITYVGAVASLRYPLIGFYIYAGFAVLRPQEIFKFAGDINSISLIIGTALLIGWAMQGFGSWRMGRGWTCLWWLLAFVSLFVLSAAMALDTARSWPYVFIYAKVIVPFLAGATLIKEERDWRALLWTLVLCQGYVGFEQNLNYLKGYNTASMGFGGMDNNFFGLSLVTTIGPAIALTQSAKSWKAWSLAVMAAAFILHTILLTFSRGAMLGLLAIGLMAFIMMLKRPKSLAAMLVIALIALRFTGPQLMARYGTTFVPEAERDSSAESRVELWQDCLKVMEAYPILGVGPANWRKIASDYGWPEGKSAHSVWMETAAEIGTPAAAILLLFFTVTAVRLWPLARARQSDDNRDEIWAANGVILGMIGFVVSGQFVSAPGLEVPYYLALVGIGILKTKTVDASVTAKADAWTPVLSSAGAIPLRAAQRLTAERR